MNKNLIVVFLFNCLPIAGLAQTMMVTSGTTISVQPGTDLFIRGMAGFEDNTTLKNEGKITIAREVATVADFIDLTTVPYNYGAGQFLFTGPGNQNLFSPNLFGSIVVNNVTTVLTSDIRAGSWMLQKGVIHTGSYNLIVNSTAENALAADAANPGFSTGWINGNLRRYVDPANVDSYRFPVGDGTHVAMLSMDNFVTNPLTGVSYVTVSFGAKLGSDAGLNVSESSTKYASIHAGGVWRAVPDANPTDGRFNFRLPITGFTGLVDNSFAMLVRPAGSSTASQWQVPPGSLLPANGSAGRTVASGYAQRNWMSSFGDFGIGIALTVLPLHLVEFTGVKKEKSVLLEWTTSEEENTGVFEVYRSGGQGPAQLIGTVNAAGFSTLLQHYSFADMDPQPGMNYYQLKMIDLDNKFTMSNTVKVKFDNEESWKVYPNPVTAQAFFVEHSGAAIKDLQLITMDGKKVGLSLQPITNNQVKVTLASSVAKGNYVLQLTSSSGTSSRLITIR